MCYSWHPAGAGLQLPVKAAQMLALLCAVMCHRAPPLVVLLVLQHSHWPSLCAAA